MTKKHIIINGCHDCDYGRGYHCDDYKGYICDKLWIAQPNNSDVYKYKDAKTIHPDCPLKDYKEQEWISVEDKLPDDAQYVLITYKQFSYDDSVVRLGWYCAFTDKWWHGDDLVNVIHWMPLPGKLN